MKELNTTTKASTNDSTKTATPTNSTAHTSSATTSATTKASTTQPNVGRTNVTPSNVMDTGSTRTGSTTPQGTATIQTGTTQTGTKPATQTHSASSIDTAKVHTLQPAESIAGLRVLMCVAHADGRIEDRERDALKMTLDAVTLPAGTTLDSLLQEKIDLDAQLALIKTPGAGEQLFQSALAIAHSGNVPADKVDAKTRKVLDRIRDHFKITEAHQNLLERMWGETKDTVLPSNIKAISDPTQRAAEVDKDVMKYSIMSAVLGSFPVPGVAIATDLGVVALQVKMVRDIGQYWGHTVDRAAARSLLGALGLGTGMRIAVSNLAKFVPGWGSVVGGTTSFASTWALGKVARKYFEGGMKTDIATLKPDFRSAENEGRATFAQQSDAIQSKQKETRERLSVLQKDLESGKLTRADYEAKVASLA